MTCLSPNLLPDRYPTLTWLLPDSYLKYPALPCPALPYPACALPCPGVLCLAGAALADALASLNACMEWRSAISPPVCPSARSNERIADARHGGATPRTAKHSHNEGGLRNEAKQTAHPTQGEQNSPKRIRELNAPRRISLCAFFVLFPCARPRAHASDVFPFVRFRV